MLDLRKKDNAEVRLYFMFTIILVFILRESVNHTVNSTSRRNMNSHNVQFFRAGEV